MPEIATLFDSTIDYITQNKKSAWPYKHYSLLQTLVDIHSQKEF